MRAKKQKKVSAKKARKTQQQYLRRGPKRKSER